MDTLQQKREAAAAKAEAIAGGAKAAERTLSAEEVGQIRGLVDQIKDFDTQLKNAADAEALLGSIGQTPEFKQLLDSGDAGAKTLGRHFLKTAGKQLVQAKGTRFSVAAPEFGQKAASDPHVTGDVEPLLLPPQIDRNFVKEVRRDFFLTDWLGAGTLSSTAITYFIEQPDSSIEGAFTTVAEGAAKPQLHFPDYDPVTETLKKIAGFIKISDEMTEDAAFLVSEIEGRLMYQLLLFEENQLLSGDGLGTNVKGLLNRVGVQTETSANLEDNFDAVFRSLTKVETGGGLRADGIVINPVDYQRFRLTKDANDQYLAGGPFTGQYGQGGIMVDPPLWGRRTIVTPAIAAGTVLVGAGAQAATVYRKGGIRVEATNSHADDFTNNMVTVRAEERLTLAVRRPAAFVKLTLSTTPAA